MPWLSWECYSHSVFPWFLEHAFGSWEQRVCCSLLSDLYIIVMFRELYYNVNKYFLLMLMQFMGSILKWVTLHLKNKLWRGEQNMLWKLFQNYKLSHLHWLFPPIMSFFMRLQMSYFLGQIDALFSYYF